MERKIYSQQEEVIEVTDEEFTIRSDGKLFRCECGCNVFRKILPKETIYICNCCDAMYL